ncbi:aldose 1-epimerase family protein [Mucilaginibacter daejeonensis]|uniref:aldose 1-epimerase family protein n=1 Tax=Mucilaginibacter daejeonensis TaxID=398049 RepID=UPI001D172D52|nr:aldose 1-epimerase family protein [Mucilaginibacter daejeonensis]UEG54409.1 aldose 1-epimerase family protein [Mucilaginibacter daejeonensis]
MIIIENDRLRVAISGKGAQLSSLYNKGTHIEHMWQADPNVWPWHAPNLFPIVGGLYNNQLNVDGQSYELPRHGFARQSEFELIGCSATHAVFQLTADEETLAVYPYQFAFQVLYDLFDNTLRVTYKVINLDDKTIYFSVGGHPAFNVPFGVGERYEDYYLEFEVDEALHTHMLSPAGYFNGETRPVMTEGGKLKLTRSLFNADALVLKDLKSRKVTIRSAHSEHSLSVEFPHFKQLGIWAKPGADFVCIEPWLGYADADGSAVDIKDKEGIQKVDHGHVFEAAYTISVS